MQKKRGSLHQASRQGHQPTPPGLKDAPHHLTFHWTDVSFQSELIHSVRCATRIEKGPDGDERPQGPRSDREASHPEAEEQRGLSTSSFHCSVRLVTWMKTATGSWRPACRAQSPMIWPIPFTGLADILGGTVRRRVKVNIKVIFGT